MQGVGSSGAGGGGLPGSGAESFLSMYNEQPVEELTLQDFEVLALDRLKGAACALLAGCTALPAAPACVSPVQL